MNYTAIRPCVLGFLSEAGSSVIVAMGDIACGFAAYVVRFIPAEPYRNHRNKSYKISNLARFEGLVLRWVFGACQPQLCAAYSLTSDDGFGSSNTC